MLNSVSSFSVTNPLKSRNFQELTGTFNVPAISFVSATKTSVTTTLTNYDAAMTYVVSSSAGTASRTNETITVSGLSSGQSTTVTTTATGSKGLAFTTTSSSFSSLLEDFSLISTVNLSSPTSSVDFSLNSSFYTDLYLVVHTRSTNSSTKDQVIVQFNNDENASNYSSGYISIDGSNSSNSFSFTRTTSTSGIRFSGIPAANASSSTMGMLEIDFYNVLSNYYKTVLAKGGFGDLSADPLINSGYYSGSWRNTDQITNIKIKLASGANFIANSTFSLYAIVRTGGGGF